MQAEPVAPPSVAISDTARMVDEAIEVKDSSDALEVATKAHFKQVIESVAKFQPLYTTAKGRERELMSGAEG
jgi:hypothetical protein